MFIKVFDINLSNIRYGLSLLFSLVAVLVIAAFLNLSVIIQVLASTELANSPQFIRFQQSYFQSDQAMFRAYFQKKVNSLIYNFDSQYPKNSQPVYNSINRSSQTTTRGLIRDIETKKMEKIEQERLALLERQKNMISPNAKILLVGDSMIKEHTGIVFERNLTSMGFEIIRDSKYSTGFTNTAYFDWSARIQELVSTYNPEAIIVYMGANDGQKIWSEADGRYYEFGNANWEKEYYKNVKDFINSTGNSVKKIYLMGHPITSSPDFNSKFVVINRVFSDLQSEFKKLEFVDVWPRFSPSGNFERVIEHGGKKLYVKFEDGVHLTDHGSEIAFDVLKNNLENDILK